MPLLPGDHPIPKHMPTSVELINKLTDELQEVKDNLKLALTNIVDINNRLAILEDNTAITCSDTKDGE